MVDGIGRDSRSFVHPLNGWLKNRRLEFRPDRSENICRRPGEVSIAWWKRGANAGSDADSTSAINQSGRQSRNGFCICRFALKTGRSSEWCHDGYDNRLDDSGMDRNQPIY
jgi:hypothetical protein